MLQECINKIQLVGKSDQLKLVAVTLVAVFVFSTVALASGFIPTNRDTRMPPGVAAFPDVPDHAYGLMGQFGDLRYYFRADRDIIKIVCTRTGYTWRTGLDAPFGQDLSSAIAGAQTDEELRQVAEPREEQLNATWTAFANSLLTVEFFDASRMVNRISSAARTGTTSTLVEVGAGHFRLDTHFHQLDLHVPVHIHLNDVGMTLHVYDHELSGPGVEDLAAIVLAPFMGAQGGTRSHFNFETMDYDPPEPVEMLPGYIFVPDGSGALIRFRENTVALTPYTGHVFGENPAEAQFFVNADVWNVDRPHPLMPVFGVTHGYRQQSFVAWADSGAQYMEIIAMPHQNVTLYNFVYPRFVFNGEIFQVYNRRGDGFFRVFPQRRSFDITMQYRFLFEDDASYVGMARTYRQHLIDTGVLTPNQITPGEPMPMRLDFIMSDVRRSVFGRTNVVTTTASQVTDILTELAGYGVQNMSSGLLGFQNGGVTTGRPWAINFSRAIGTRREFTRMFDATAALGADVSFAQNYFEINSHQMNLARNQAFHLNRWGLVAYDSFEPFLPVNAISYARPERSAQWLRDQSNRANNVGAHSHTIIGISNNLTSHWGRGNATDAATSMEIIAQGFRDVPLPVNAHSPNMFLWQYTTRFLQAPVFNTQFMIQTDTVPFLQMVLHNTMEVFAPYSNFSFYTQRDILRMIDYNVYPSFVLTYSPAHYLANTNSLNFYSTEFDVYREIIMNVYTQASAVLSQVRHLEWVNRTLLAEGIVLNTYAGGVEVLINYTAEPFNHRGVHVAPLSAEVFS